MKLILGNITFEGQIGKGAKATVHEVFGVIDCSKAMFADPKETALSIGEELCNEFQSYIIPEIYDGEIEYECLASCSFDVSELENKH